MSKYILHRYMDGVEIGRAEMTDEEFNRYESSSQMPEGIVRLGDLPPYYVLHPAYRDVHEDTDVYYE